MHFDCPEDYFYYYLQTDGRMILDAGSGLGSNTLFLAQRIVAEGGKSRIIAVDSDESDLEYAKKRLGNLSPYVQFLNEHLHDMTSIPERSVDSIYLSNTLIWLEAKPLYSLRALREFHRILKPGGFLSVLDQMPMDRSAEVTSIWSRVWEIQKGLRHFAGESHLTEISPQDIAYALELAGFSDVEFEIFDAEMVHMEHTRQFIERLSDKLRNATNQRLAAIARQSLLDMRKEAPGEFDRLPPVYVLHARKYR